MNYVIEHIDDIQILYNGKGKHDKIYIVVTCRSDEWPEMWYVKGLYRARTSTKYNVSEISQSSSKSLTMIHADEIVREKIRKGYDAVMDDRQNAFFGFPATKSALISQFQDIFSHGQSNDNPSLEEYECIDDFGEKGRFIVGMHYMGRPDKDEKLMMMDDDGKQRIVDKDNFLKV